jgi:hypothetical protein
MKRVYELDVYKPAEELADMAWHDFDKWDKIVQKHEDQIANFNVPRTVTIKGAKRI